MSLSLSLSIYIYIYIYTYIYIYIYTQLLLLLQSNILCCWILYYTTTLACVLFSSILPLSQPFLVSTFLCLVCLVKYHMV